MKIHIIRHGEKEKGNFYNSLLKRQDNPLSEKGFQQAEVLKEYLPSRINSVFVSNLIRTRQTISPFTHKHTLNIHEDKRLNEIDMGIMSLYPENEVKEKHPLFWKEFQSKSTDFRYPDGENGNDVSIRIKSFIREHYDSTNEIALITHDGLIRVFFCMILGLDYHYRFKFKIANCGISTIVLDSENGNGCIEKINDCSYMKELLSYDK